MSKFCMYCGSEMDDNASICPSCGSNQTPAESPESAVSPAAPSDGGLVGTIKGLPKNLKIIFISGAAVLVIVILIVLRLIFSSSYTDPIDGIFKAMETGKGKYYYDCFPEFILQEEFNTAKKSKIMDALDEAAEEMHDKMEDKYGDDFDITYKIKDKEEIDEDDLSDLEKDIKRRYKERVNISAGWEIKAKIKIKGEDDHDNDTSTFRVYKIDGDWCFIDVGLVD